LTASDEAEARAAHNQLLVVALDNIAGWMAFSDWRVENRPIAHIASASVEQLKQRLTSITVLDVREASEWNSGVVPGALKIPYSELNSRKGEVPMGEPVAVMCQSGAR